MHSPLQAVLFDLDGTLIDTAPDLAAALNAVRVGHGREPLSFEQIRPQVSHGATALTRLGFADLAEDSEAFASRREQLLENYAAAVAVHSRLFPGFLQLFDFIDNIGIVWGIVTNKPAYLTLPLLNALGLNQRAGCIVSGDTTAERKPHPLPLLHACESMAADPRACVYVGDAQRDIEAGWRAGMQTLVALFGYLSPQDRPETWGADGLVRDAAEIVDWLAARAARPSLDIANEYG
jgi:phosphoglycolate phosphatase